MGFKLLKALGEHVKKTEVTRLVLKFCMNRGAELFNSLEFGSNTELAIEE